MAGEGARRPLAATGNGSGTSCANGSSPDGSKTGRSCWTPPTSTTHAANASTPTSNWSTAARSKRDLAFTGPEDIEADNAAEELVGCLAMAPDLPMIDQWRGTPFAGGLP